MQLKTFAKTTQKNSNFVRKLFLICSNMRTIFFRLFYTINAQTLYINKKTTLTAISNLFSTPCLKAIILSLYIPCQINPLHRINNDFSSNVILTPLETNCLKIKIIQNIEMMIIIQKAKSFS